MILTETRLAGAFVCELAPFADERGFFARAFNQPTLREHGIRDEIRECYLSGNTRAGTVRGMHYQVPPHTETKIVRCIRGAIYDVIVDLREGSPTYLRHVGVELSAENRRALVVPDLFAHGFQSLTDDAELLYLVTELYAPDCEAGLPHDDPALGIEWPLPVTAMSDKDRAWPRVASGIPVLEPRRGLPAR